MIKEEDVMEWTDKINQMNDMSDVIIHGRKELYSLIADEIKSVCGKYTKSIPKISFSPTGREIKLYFELGTEEEYLLLSEDFLRELKFPVKMKIKDGFILVMVLDLKEYVKLKEE